MLHFPEVTDATFGTYKCRVTGNNGRQEFTKPVRVESGVSEGVCDTNTQRHVVVQIHTKTYCLL